MTWFTLALIPPIFWAISNIVDSYISRDKGRNIWESLIIVNLSKLPFLLMFGGVMFYKGISFGGNALLWGMLLGGLYTIAVLLYLIILQKEESSLALPLYEIGPIWSTLLGLTILSEIPSLYSIVGILIIIVGGYILSREGGGSHKIKKSIIPIFGLVIISSLLFNTTYILFKHAHGENSLYELFFFQYIFQVIFSVTIGAMMNQIRYKKNCVKGDKNIWTLSIIGESIGIFGTFLIMFSFISGPVSVVRALGATQMIWVLFISFILSRFYPKYFLENWDKETGYRKVLGVFIIFLGILVLGYENYL